MNWHSNRNSVVTRTSETETFYLAQSERIAARFERETSHKWQGNEQLFIEWLEARRNEVTSSTWRLYRAGLIYWAGIQKRPVLEDRIGHISTAGCVRRTAKPLSERNTSARKKKSLSESERVELFEAFSESWSKYARACSWMIEGGRIAGLLPYEWKEAVFQRDEDQSLWLVVKNGKATNGRALGATRRLDMGELSTDELSVVQAMIAIAADHREEWKRFYDACRKRFRITTKRLWPNRAIVPTLYSGRHQFAADAKAAGLTKPEVAALMGHGWDRTAGAHYGKKRVGRSGFKVAPHPEDVKRVTVTAEPTRGPQFAP
jgi:hypothetical protein